MSLRLVQKMFKNSKGNISTLFALIMVPLIALGAAGVDLARYEAVRTELQSSLDSGVLAAASMTQKRPVDEVLREYLKNLPYASDVKVDYTREITATSREIRATASYPIKTAFIQLVGVKTLTANVYAGASEAVQNIELSLALDISYSMHKNNRMGNMKKAAKEFVEQILAGRNKDFTSISIIPYAGHVNVSKAVFNKLGAERLYKPSSCIEYGEYRGKYYGADPPDFKNRRQVPHFRATNREIDQPWWCPVESTSILYLSNDKAALKKHIDGLEMHWGTGTQHAMQWAYNLLNPAGRTITKAAKDAKKMDKKFANRPVKFNSKNTVKVIVLMTDGKVTGQQRPKEGTKPSTTEVNLHFVSSEEDTEIRLKKVCDAAKKNGITVFTIGFEVGLDDNSDDDAEKDMIDCATSRKHYYPASGSGISGAFNSIANSIQRLRLTQ